MRPPTADDAPAVLQLLVARDLADYGVPDITLEDLRDEWSAQSFDLTADAVLVEDSDGRVAGYSAIHRQGALGFVHPEREGRGIGTQLVLWAQRRERERGRDWHGQAAAAGNRRARVLFERFGYARVRSYARLVRALHGSETEHIPPGIALRAPDPERDAAALHALNERAFAANPDYVPEALEAFVDEHLRAHDHAPDLSLAAYEGRDMVGFLLARRWSQESVGFVDLLAVAPDARGRGIGSALLRTAFARCAAAGLREAQLGVASDNPRALGLYERAGMTPRFVLHAYHRPVDGAP